MVIRGAEPVVVDTGMADNEDQFLADVEGSPEEPAVARAFEGYGEKVEEPGEVRAALQRGLKAIAGSDGSP